MNTNIIERFHGSLKSRTKAMRGLRNPESAALLLSGWLVHYNFFRPHEFLRGGTPSEVAGIRTTMKDWGVGGWVVEGVMDEGTGQRVTRIRGSPRCTRRIKSVGLLGHPY